MITIREAQIEDASRILAIYAPYIERTAITFEYDVPPLEEFENRIVRIKAVHPYLVAEENGEIIAYCYAAKFHERKACERSVEVSIYVDRARKRSGIGRGLYGEMERRLKEEGVTNVYVSIADSPEEDEYLTKDSIYFHEKMGFVECGRFHLCGIKFGKGYDLVYMEKIL